MKTFETYEDAAADFKERQRQYSKYMLANNIRSRKARKNAMRKFGLAQHPHPDPADFRN